MDNTNFLVRQEKQLGESLLKDSLKILALYFVTILVIYKLPGLMGYLLFILFYILFYKSKKDYFWLAFFYAICTGPGGFFYISEEVTIGQLPIFRIGGGVNISSVEILLILAVFKAFNKGKKQQIPLAKPLGMLLFYSLFLFIVSFFVFGTPIIRFLKDLRYFFYFFSIIPLSYLVYKEGEGEKLIYCFFPFIFLSFFSAVYYIFMGNYFVNLFAPGLMRQITLGIKEGGSRYVTSLKGGGEILIFGYIFSLFLLFKTRLKKRRIYLSIIAWLSYIIVLLSATRVWFVVFSFMFITMLIIIRKNLKIVGGGIMIAVLLCVPYLMVPKIHNFANLAWIRIASVFEINREDSIAYTAIEAKKTRRLAKTMVGIKENPLVGWGDSNQFFEYTGGGDIGNFNLILQVGIIGFLLFINFWMQYFLLVCKSNRKLSQQNPYRGALLFLNISLTGLLISHFTTHQIFGMVITQAPATFIAFFVFLSGYFVKDALRTEYFLAKSNKM
ncbi:MAG TPA: hypothetical protein VK186_02765 [Candidatus Deferrimicrobium sp.]|nr:hypothetical protein [Candidatus Deferrimicrobium sp.]